VAVRNSAALDGSRCTFQLSKLENKTSKRSEESKDKTTSWNSLQTFPVHLMYVGRATAAFIDVTFLIALEFVMHSSIDLPGDIPCLLVLMNISSNVLVSAKLRYGND
jgi:hypothetical protein